MILRNFKLLKASPKITSKCPKNARWLFVTWRTDNVGEVAWYSNANFTEIWTSFVHPFLTFYFRLFIIRYKYFLVWKLDDRMLHYKLLIKSKRLKNRNIFNLTENKVLPHISHWNFCIGLEKMWPSKKVLGLHPRLISIDVILFLRDRYLSPFFTPKSKVTWKHEGLLGYCLQKRQLLVKAFFPRQ